MGIQLLNSAYFEGLMNLNLGQVIHMIPIAMNCGLNFRNRKSH